MESNLGAYGQADNEDCMANTTNRVETASLLFDSAAKTVGIAQLALKHVGVAEGKILLESASKTLELAQAQLREARDEAEEKNSSSNSEGRVDVPPGDKNTTVPWKRSRSEKDDCMVKPNSNGGTSDSSKKRRHFDGSDVVDDGKANLNSLKKSKTEKAIPAASMQSSLPFLFDTTSSTTHSTVASSAPFSFGNVPATLPAGPFLFGSKSSATTTTSSASSAQTSSVGTDSVSPAGKRKLPAESSAGGATKPPETVLKSRKIVKANRKWCSNKGAVKSADGGKIASIFAAVKLAPSTTTAESKQEKQSCGSATAPAPSARSTPAFSFAAHSSSTGTQTASNSTNKAGTNDVGNVNEPKQEKNPEEETIYEVRAVRRKKDGTEWIKYGAGVLRLYRHKQTSKCRMVIRNDIGQVQFNVEVSKGMSFHKVVKDTKKGKSTYVRFGAVEDARNGMETFLLQVKPEFVDKLHESLEGMAGNQ